MSLGQTLRILRSDFNCLSHWQQAGNKQLAQRFALYQLHRNVVSRTVLAEFVDGYDIWVVEGRCRARFLLEAVQPVTVCGERGGQNLDRHTAIKSRIPRPVHLSHAARTKWGLDLIGTEFCARGQCHPSAPL